MAKLLDIITNPNPILRQVSLPVKKEDISTPEFQTLVEDMALTMLKKDGVGLAAPQIGQNIQVIVINYKKKILCLINPILSKKSWAKKVAEEGCLSVPNVFGDVKRHRKLVCTFLDQNAKMGRIEASDMLARIIQHENDHLEGVLFIDKAENIKKEK